MSTLRFITLLGCTITLVAGLGAWLAPAWANSLMLTAAIGTAAVLVANALPAGNRPDSEAAVMPTVPAAMPPPPPPVQSEQQDLLAELERHKALEQQLMVAKQEAEAATMAKGEFLATMSHEIRTPLNGIIPLLDLVLATELSVDQRDYLSTAFGSAKELLRIVDDILDYSKLDAQKLQLETIGINLRELCSNVIRLMEKSAEAKALRLELSIDPSVRLAVRGDPVRLRQVLTNLISNAIKFTSRGGVSLHLQQLGETRTRNQLRFEVRDTGIGIAPEAAAQLFQPFTQADASTTRSFGGTGLGLAICKRIITLMGGRIGVNSIPDRGSIFWFEVPLDKALGDIEGRATVDFSALRTLLVSANEAQQKRLATALRSWGTQPVLTSNTQETLTRLRATHRPGQRAFDLVLVDVASIPTTALALHRALARETQAEQTLRVYLLGEAAVPEELRSTPGFFVVSRNSADTALRTRILALLDMPVEERVATASGPAEAATEPDTLAAPPAPVERLVPEPTSPQTRNSRTKPGTKPTPPAKAGASSASVRPIRPLSDSTPSQAQAEPPPPAPPASAPVTPAANSETTADAAGAKVLLVEDNPVNRQVAQRLLSLAGIHFDSAENGKEALEQMNAGQYAAVLMDCQMPIMDGYTATRKRREHEANQTLPRLPIIAMTANAMLGDREKCLEAGMDDYMSKPLSRALLESTLKKWLDEPPRVSIAPVPAEPEPTAPAADTTIVAAPAEMAASPHIPAAVGPALDQGILNELREIMGAEFITLVQVFLEDAPLALERIKSLAARSDLAAIAAPAHTLKSTSANLGALRLSGMAKAMEMESRQQTLRAAPAKAAALAGEFERVAAALRQEIA